MVKSGILVFFFVFRRPHGACTARASAASARMKVAVAHTDDAIVCAEGAPAHMETTTAHVEDAVVRAEGASSHVEDAESRADCAEAMTDYTVAVQPYQMTQQLE